MICKTTKIGLVMLMKIQPITLTLTDGKEILISEQNIKKFDSGLIAIHINDYLIGIAPMKTGSYDSFVEYFPKPSTYTSFDNRDNQIENLSLSKDSMDLIISLTALQ